MTDIPLNDLLEILNFKNLLVGGLTVNQKNHAAKVVKIMPTEELCYGLALLAGTILELPKDIFAEPSLGYLTILEAIKRLRSDDEY